MALPQSGRTESPEYGLDWKSLLKTGLLGGIVALFLSLVGIVEASNARPVIQGLLSLGQTLLLVVYLLIGYGAAQQAWQRDQKNHVLPILSSAVTGVLISIVLALLVVIGERVNLRAVFVNASPALYDILTFGLGTPVGEIVLLLFGAVVGAAVGALFLLPERIRRAVMVGLATIPAVSILLSALFAGSGLSLPAAIAVFAVSAAASYFWSARQSTARQRISTLPPAQQQAIRRGSLVLAVALLLMLPLLGSYPSEVLDVVGYFAVMGLGLNIVVGFAGLLDLGYVAFFAIGAYTVGILTSPEIQWLGIRLTFWEALPFAVLASTLAGTLLGIPVLGMRGDYLAIVTLGFGEIIRLLVLSDWLKPYIGGSNGITRIPKPMIGPIALDTPQKLYYFVLVCCVITAFIATRVKYSRVGRNWMAVREDEDVAQAMGIDLVRTKLLAFATGAAFAGLSGAIFATKLGSIYPHSFNVMVSINVLVLIIVGGLGSIPGVFVGALVLVGLPELLREFAEYRLLVYGVALVFMMQRRPEGLLPEARRKVELHEVEASE